MGTTQVVATVGNGDMQLRKFDQAGYRRGCGGEIRVELKPVVQIKKTGTRPVFFKDSAIILQELQLLVRLL
jgi:hypothetical protein